MTLTTNKTWPSGPFGGLFSPNLTKDLFADLNFNFDEAFNIKSDYPYDIFVERNDEKQVTAYNLNYALSGFSQEDISVKVIGDELRINVSRQKDDEAQEYVHHGIARRNTRVSFKLGTMVDKEKITMDYVNGLLKIRIPTISESVFDVKFK